MITVESFHEWEQRQEFEKVEAECEECGGDGDCECCGRECLSCDGTGIAGEQDLPEWQIQLRYFNDVMDALKRLCAFSSRHDFLTEAGDFIKRHGRPSPVIGWIKPSDTVH